MLIAVKKEEGSIPGGGFHYMTLPKPLEGYQLAMMWRAMGWEVIDVDDAIGKQIIEGAEKALAHHWMVAQLVDGKDHKRIKDPV